MRQYTVLVYRDPNNSNDWLGHVPAVQGAFSSGDSRDEALAMTEEALALVIEFLFDQGETLPTDSVDLEREREEVAALLGAAPLDLEAVRVNVELEARVLAA
jgi:predicted RNase H-like HicB family nuclease